jgi:serine/threonine protein phosphatase PrpC
MQKNDHHDQKVSTNHKPNVPEVAMRIKATGLKVVGKLVPQNDGPDLRIQLPKGTGSKGSEGALLACSRAFGDSEYKMNASIGPELQVVIANPEVNVRERGPLDAFVILACDSMWDVLSSEGAAALVMMRTHHYLFSSE